MTAPNLSTAEAAALSGYKPSTLRAMRHRGKGPPFLQPEGKGRKAVYPRAAFEAWMKGAEK